ncbi:MAG TPA: proton-conducting transporter membrane subunit, partial [Phycisphaeraceae bacterium]
MLSVWMVLAGGAMLAVSGLPACLLPARSLAGQRMSAGLMLIGGALGLTGVAISLSQAQPMMLSLPWFLPWGRFAAAVDPLSAVFLVLVFIVPALGSVYGLGYWPAPEHPESSRRLGVFYGLLAGAMALVTVARDGVLFLIAWEVMALAAYFAATAQENNPQVRRAGWVYLVATHAGTLCLLAMFALWRSATGSFAMEAVEWGTGPSAELAGAIFVLAVIGFGFKAGLMPLHVWLPGAHASAPSHVSAVMSGVMLKMGVYGLVRMTALLPEPAAWWGGMLLAMGAVTGVAGIALAVGQDDLKRLLAYSSIENIGVITMGLGLALLGRSQGQPQWVALGLAGCLLHMRNHGLFKPLLFCGAGAVIHATGARQMDRLGGLAKRMPQVTALFVVGAVAISALPPMNGFVSEWLLYVGLFSTLGGVGQEGGLPAAAAGAVVLAMIGALAVVCFVKVVGVVFLGSPREAGLSAHDPPAS